MKENDCILLEVSSFFSKNTQNRQKVIKKKKKRKLSRTPHVSKKNDDTKDFVWRGVTDI